MTEGLFRLGVEREGLRVDACGKIVQTPHPAALFPEALRKNIATDFAEAQPELKTGICGSTEECYKELSDITNAVLQALRAGEEYLWPYSMPALICDRSEKVCSTCEGRKEEAAYRKALYRKYDLEMLLVSGVHFNFSFAPGGYDSLLSRCPALPKDVDDGYFRILQNLRKREAECNFLFGASPFAFDQNAPARYAREDKYSIRNSKRGYRNHCRENVDFTSKEAYQKSLLHLVETGELLGVREYYAPLRLRFSSCLGAFCPFDRIEIRFTDLNPFSPCGITKEDMDLLILLIMTALYENTDETSPLSLAAAEANKHLQLGMDAVCAELNRRLNAPSRADTVREKLPSLESLTALARQYTITANIR